MHIIDYIKKYKLKVLDAASKLKVTTFSIYRWMAGNIPRTSKIAKIKELTNGEIGESDWGLYDAGHVKASKCKASSKPTGDKGCVDLEGHADGKTKVRVSNAARKKKASKGIRIRKGDD